MIASTIEDFSPDETFDLAVMVNVLEHCFDIPLVFERVRQCLKPGGVFVFADCMFSKSRIRAVVENSYDVGHPIRMTEEFIDSCIDKHFSPLHDTRYRDLYDQKGRIDRYFIGRLQPNPARGDRALPHALTGLSQPAETCVESCA
jgi:SAM-dependent methyltransferase